MCASRPDGARPAQVRAFDKSERQLSQARAAPNITYAAALAHALPVDDGVADVITVAQTYHWLMRPDPTPFLEEARTVPDTRAAKFS